MTRGHRAMRLRDAKRRRVRRPTTIKVPVGRKARKSIRRALKAKRRTSVKLSLRARGSSGRVSVKRLSTRIIG